MWTSVFMTQNIDKAKIMRSKIENMNILVMLHRMNSVDSDGENCYELLVPDAELKDALEIIIGE